MTRSLVPSHRTFGITGLMGAIAGWLWLVVCFSAPAARWWNSLWFFLTIFLLSVTFGIIGRKSISGILGIIIGALGSSLVSFLLYIG